MQIPRWLRRLGAMPIYPVLAAVYPVAFLYAQNVHEAIAPFEILIPLALTLGGTLLAMLLFWTVTRRIGAAALMATLLFVLFFTYGMAWDAVGRFLIGSWVLVAAWLLLAIIGVSLIWRHQSRAASLAPALNLIGTLLVGVNLVIIGAFLLDVRPAATKVDGTGPTMRPPPGTTERLPDIYWVILDRYGSANVLDKYFQYDNTPFLDELRSRGFYIAEHATANYLKTAPSMTSSRSMDYLDIPALGAEATAEDDWGPLYRALQAPFAVQRYLGSGGYRFIYLGTYWGPTSKHPSAEISYVYDKLASEFMDVLVSGTILRAFQGLGPEAPYDWRRNRWNQTSYELDSLRRASSLGGPKFVHAHFSLPHEPYVFHADGSFVTEAEEKGRSREANYVDQLRFANAQMLDWLDSLLDVPPDRRPIVVLQADEGPWPLEYLQHERAFDWTSATPEQYEEKFGILSAFYLPGKTPEEAGLYPTITPVNQFRAIFHAYFGLDLPLMDDRNWIFDDQAHIYTETDVTDRVQR